MKRQPIPAILPDLLAVLLFLGLSGFGATAADPPAARSKPTLTWQNVISNVLARPGTVQPGGVYSVGIPRNDVKVTVQGVTLEPSFALTSYETFHAVGNGKTAEIQLRGHLLLLPDEVNPVLSRLMKGGFHLTALHNHLIGERPRLMDLHFDAKGAAGTLATTLRDAVGLTGMHLYPSASELLEEDQPPPNVLKGFQEVQRILGQDGTITRRVLEIHLPRREPVRNGNVEIPPPMGTCVCLDFQSAGPEKLAATGEMVVVADEMMPVLQALRMGNMEVSAIHDALMGEKPPVKYIHFWGEGSPEKVATALRAALDQMALKR